MRTAIQSVTWIGALLFAGLLASTPATARAQAPPAYYYQSAGYYSTTAGTIFIPTPGYYYNVPRNHAAAFAAYSFAQAPRYTSSGQAYRHAGVGGSSPPYYSSAVHSLHARGFDPGRRGK